MPRLPKFDTNLLTPKYGANSRFPYFARVKITGNSTGGSDQWRNKTGIIVPPMETLYIVQFENGDTATFHYSALAMDEPKPGDLVLIPALYVAPIVGDNKMCRIVLMDEITEATIDKKMVLPSKGNIQRG